MKKVFTLVKTHIKDNATVAQKHLKSNRGDGYIWFLFMTMAFLLIFGALFTIMSTAVNMRDVRTTVDVASEDVFNHMREVYYDKLTDGATDFTDINLTDEDVMKIMAAHMDATYSGSGLNPYVYKLDARGNLAYRIDNLEFTYVPQVNGHNSLIKRGDLNKDDKVDETDLTLAEKELATPTSGTNIDLNDDKVENVKDILVLKGLIKYYKTHPTDSNETSTDKSSALLLITFQVSVPVRYGPIDWGDSRDDYAYYSIISFKPA